MGFALYLYIRSTHLIRGRILCAHNAGAPVPAHRRPAVVARATRYRFDIGPLSDRCYPLSSLFCNCFCNCLTQCNLACTVWIYWATALNHTTIQCCAHPLFLQPLLALAVGVDWTAGALAGCGCKALLALAVWVHRATELGLWAVRHIDVGEHFAVLGELNVIHGVLIFFSLFSYAGIYD